jgi:xylulokinase
VTVLTLDLGTSATKAALWSGTDLVSLVRVPVETSHPVPGYAEQNPDDWWRAVLDACATLRAQHPSEYARIGTVGCSAARETFACFDGELRPLTPGILWSDTRAIDETSALGDPTEFRRRTGVVAGPGASAAKIAWTRTHLAREFRDATWVLAPRDLIAARLTGVVQTDPTLASRTGLYTLGGGPLADPELAARLPRVVSSVALHPVRTPNEAALPLGTELILGAGDRACEVLGAGADTRKPSVSWGTTANVSVPNPGPVDALPPIAQVSVGPLGGFLVEAGVSAAGAALEWLGRLTGQSTGQLLTAAASAPVGANGLLALAWLYGARAPWWQPDARAAFLGVTGAHGAPDFARALVEGIGLDVARSLELVAPDAEALVLAGAGAGDELWRTVLGGVTGRPLVRRTLGDAASAGARLLIGHARAEAFSVDDVNPVVERELPSPEITRAYRPVRAAADQAAATVLDRQR